MLFTYLTATLCLMNLQSSMVLVKLSTLTYHWRGSSCQGRSVVLAYSSSLSTLGRSCEYCFFSFVVTSLWLSSQDCTMVCQPTLNTCFSISYMSYANQTSPYFLGCHLAFPGNTFVGLAQFHHSGIWSSHHCLWDYFF